MGAGDSRRRVPREDRGRSVTTLTFTFDEPPRVVDLVIAAGVVALRIRGTPECPVTQTEFAYFHELLASLRG